MKNTKKNIIPVIAVLVLIVIIILFMLLGRLIEKYTPSKEHQELSEYYGLASDDSVALIFNNEVLSVQGRLIDGNVYLDFETVHDKINSRFFWDANENKLFIHHRHRPDLGGCGEHDLLCDQRRPDVRSHDCKGRCLHRIYCDRFCKTVFRF